MFAGCDNIININFIQFNTKYITNMKGMFLNCFNLKNINLLSFNTKKVIDMSYMFKNCGNLQNNLDFSSFDFNSVINKDNMLSNFCDLINNKKDKYEILSSEYKKVDLRFKIIIIGNEYSARVHLINYCKKNIFKNTYLSKGYEYHDFNIRIKDKIIKLQVCNTCGQEIYRSLTNLYHNASLAIIIYSINDRKSFDDIDLLMKDCRSNGSPDMKFFIVGNKIDIDEKE